MAKTKKTEEADPITIDACIEWLQDQYDKITHPDYQSVDEVMLLDSIELLKRLKKNNNDASGKGSRRKKKDK